MAVDVSSVPLGERTLRLLVADAAGNVAARQGTARVTGAGRAARPPTRSRGSGARGCPCGWSAPGGPATRAGASLVARIGVGRTVTIAGRLRDARARAIAGAEIRARGHRGVVVGPDADPPGRALPARRAPDGRWPACHRGPGRARAPAVARRAGGRDRGAAQGEPRRLVLVGGGGPGGALHRSPRPGAGRHRAGLAQGRRPRVARPGPRGPGGRW